MLILGQDPVTVLALAEAQEMVLVSKMARDSAVDRAAVLVSVTVRVMEVG